MLLSRTMILTSWVLLSWHLTAAFQVPQSQEWRPIRRKPLLFSSRGDSEKPPRNGWDDFKNMFYSSIDSVKDAASIIKGESKNGTEEPRVEEGYASFEESMKQSPAKKLMSEYQARASTLGVDDAPAPSNKKSGFDSFKENIYKTADALGNDSVDTEPIMDRSVPYKRSLAQELNNEDLLSSNPIKRFQAEQELREREAQRRVAGRNEGIKAKKQDLYNFIDAFQSTMESLPDKVAQMEKAVNDMAQFVQSVPNLVEKRVEDVKAIPDRVQQSVDKTKKSVEESIEKTKKGVLEVRDIPNKVTQKIEDTKRAVQETKESVGETVTKVKVLIGVEKPKPMPPKLPPPKPKSNNDVVLDVAGRIAGSVGQFAFWATKEAANLAWSGAQAAVTKGTETLQKDNPKLGGAKAVPTGNKAVPTGNKGVADTEDVEKEVADALRLAEASLRKASLQKQQSEPDT